MRPGRIPRRAAPLLCAALVAFACKTVAPPTHPPTLTPTAATPENTLSFTPDLLAGTPHPAYELTASDGTGLRLVLLDVRAVVQGPLALTQLHLVFQNPDNRTIEGRFAVTLPEGAAVSRFAMKIAGTWQDGEVVERLAATQIYESFLHRRVDPALLEHDAGNRFRARVFPILPNERKDLILTYSQELTDAGATYRLPLLGLPQLDSLAVRVITPGQPALTLDRTNYVPEGDLVLRLDPTRGPAGVRNGSLVAARVDVVADGPAATVAPAAAWTILLDTSASQAVGFAARVERLKRLLDALAAREGRATAVEIVGFDQEQVVLYRGPAVGFDNPQIAAVLARGALGATDTAAALRWAQRAVQAGARVVIVSDGIATAGQTHTAALTSAANDLRAAGVARIDALLAGSPGDRQALHTAATPTGVVLADTLPADAAAARLLAPVLHNVAVEVAGSRWVLPPRLDGVQPGDSVVVYAEVDDPAPLRVQFKAAPLRAQQVATTPIDRPLLERSMRGAELRELVAQHASLAAGDSQRAALQGRIVDLSLAHRVLSPFTALLVLETEADYTRFKLDRRALSDILVVGDAGLELLARDLKGVLTRVRANRTSPAQLAPLTAGDDTASPRAASDPVASVDTDTDGVVDALDGCPNQPEDRDGVEDDDGCPDLLRFDNCQIRLTDRVYFKYNRADIDPKSHKLLDDVRDTLNAAPDLDVWIDGHTDSKGSDKYNRDLSQRRVDAVKKYLVEKGKIAEARLEPRGMGEQIPIQDNKTADGRAANRRVEFNLKQCTKQIAYTPPPPRPALAGRFLAVDEALAQKPAEALQLARAWWADQPGDVLAALALGRALAAAGQPAAALRAYGSLIDLAPSRAEHRRHAGERLESLGAVDLAVDTYRHAVQQRPDHPSSHRLLALALARLGRHAEAFAALEVGLQQKYPEQRFRGVDVILGDDLAIVAAAWIRSDPAARVDVTRRLAARNLTVADQPSLRFALTWEADVANVDLHLTDARGQRNHDSINNVDGYGPDLVRIRDRAYPYTVRVHYGSQRMAGHAMGAVQVLEHDGHGRLGFLTLPFVLMLPYAGLDVGVLSGPLIPSA